MHLPSHVVELFLVNITLQWHMKFPGIFSHIEPIQVCWPVLHSSMSII